LERNKGISQNIAYFAFRGTVTFNFQIVHYYTPHITIIFGFRNIIFLINKLSCNQCAQICIGYNIVYCTAVSSISAIFRTRTRVYIKTYINEVIEEVMGHRLLVATGSMASWEGTTILVFVATTMCLPILFFSESTKEVFNVQGARHSPKPNTLTTMIHGQAFCIRN
jgi:hypothetical protein